MNTLPEKTEEEPLDPVVETLMQEEIGRYFPDVASILKAKVPQTDASGE